MQPSHSASALETEVAVIGAGIHGLFNALQFAKRGLKVVLIDDLANQKRSYKVGESFLVFTSAFLRTIGGLDGFLNEESFIKLGVWFSHGAEHAPDFRGATEWAMQADPHPPHYLYDHTPEEKRKWFRGMYLDMQIVRPEAEDRMLEQVKAHPLITLVGSARVRDVVLGEGDALHEIHWADRARGEAGVTRARWMMDCSGRNRLLARKLGHASESREMNDGFQTTAVWGQFEGISDALFDERWSFRHEDGRNTPRDLYTLHLWGEGYWIWVIRLSQGRISVGATFDQRKPPPGATPKEQFWSLIHRYPVLKDVLSPERLLEFRMFRDVQHMTDTFVSPRRYAMAGDAGSIIDAYYSQGIALGLVSAWHITNIVERDVRGGRLDLPYIERVNRATRQDWHMLRNMIREKYTEAVGDPRFFLLSHMLDMSVFWSVGSTRQKLTHWLVETEGDPARETPRLRAMRDYLETHLFYSQAKPWHFLAPETVQRLQRHLQAGLAERARWRLKHGVVGGALKAIQSLTAPAPKVWGLPRVGRHAVTDLSGPDVVTPPELRPGGQRSLLDLLPLSVTERLDWVIRLRMPVLFSLFALGYGWDWADTGARRLALRLRGRKAAAPPAAAANDRPGAA
jgi:2-polyprenyl-6-methoxyphenol hydroxylase-like FAD-dependent oxidoreductase